MPIINIKENLFLSIFIVFKNLNDAPMPSATVATLCVDNAVIKEVLNINSIAGSCIIPAPPPENAENKLDINETTNK